MNIIAELSRNMKMPTSCPAKRLAIAGKVYDIEGYAIDSLVSNGPEASGYTNDRMQVIKYNETAHEQHIKDTLLHELIHAIDYNTQLGLTEAQVHSLSGSLLGVFWHKDNKRFTSWLMEK